MVRGGSSGQGFPPAEGLGSSPGKYLDVGIEIARNPGICPLTCRLLVLLAGAALGRAHGAAGRAPAAQFPGKAFPMFPGVFSSSRISQGVFAGGFYPLVLWWQKGEIKKETESA